MQCRSTGDGLFQFCLKKKNHYFALVFVWIQNYRLRCSVVLYLKDAASLLLACPTSCQLQLIYLCVFFPRITVKIVSLSKVAVNNLALVQSSSCVWCSGFFLDLWGLEFSSTLKTVQPLFFQKSFPVCLSPPFGATTTN